jgi:feruloyl-CoA synthase
MSKDYGKLKRIFDLIRPRLVYADKGRIFAEALGSLDLDGVELVVSSDPDERFPATPFDSLTTTGVTDEVGEAFARVGPDTVGKILFTSGSTGLPKGVINTQRMMCSNQQAIAQAWPFIEKKPPKTVDWLPWHHTFGGNHNFNMILRNGGTLVVDTGKPAPGLIERTVANLEEVSPSIYFNVPRGFGELLSRMEDNQRLRDTFFAELDLIFYAAASLPQPMWQKLEELSTASRGVRVQMASAWGSTETAPMAALVHFTIERAGVIGLPAPGTELKFVPSGSKLEMRVRGPNVTPGYYRRDDITEAAFDEDGFYRIGDAGKLVDLAEPAKGVVFDGRTAEDFKMASGNWVHVGWLRVAAIAAAPQIIQDAVVTGHDRDEVGLLIFPNLTGIKALAKDAPDDATLTELIPREDVREAVRSGLAAHNRDNTRISARIGRALLMDRPPAIDANEVTDKGYINQLAVLECRADLVEKLYEGGAGVIVVD